MSLVAAAEDRPGLAECYKSLKIIGPISTSVASAADGQWADLAGIGGAFGGAMDIAELVVDPIASMAASVAGFLLDYMPPLPDMLDAIAGNPRAVEAKSQTWGNVAGRVREVTADYEAAVRSALAGWDGPAATAYDTFASVYRSGLDLLAGITDGIGAAMLGASIVVGVVRSIVRDTIADLVGKLISWASQVAATVGVGATWVVPQAVTAIALRVERVREWLTKLTSAIQGLMKIIDDVNGGLSTAIPALRRVRDTLGAMPAVPQSVLDGAGNLAASAPKLDIALLTASSLSNTTLRTNDALSTANGG